MAETKKRNNNRQATEKVQSRCHGIWNRFVKLKTHLITRIRTKLTATLMPTMLQKQNNKKKRKNERKKRIANQKSDGLFSFSIRWIRSIFAVETLFLIIISTPFRTKESHLFVKQQMNGYGIGHIPFVLENFIYFLFVSRIEIKTRIYTFV